MPTASIPSIPAHTTSSPHRLLPLQTLTPSSSPRRSHQRASPPSGCDSWFRAGFSSPSCVLLSSPTRIVRSSSSLKERCHHALSYNTRASPPTPLPLHDVLLESRLHIRWSAGLDFLRSPEPPFLLPEHGSAAPELAAASRDGRRRSC